MNLLERNTHTEKKEWREDIKKGVEREDLEDGDLEELDIDAEPEDDLEKENCDSTSFLQKPYMTVVLLGIIAVLLIAIICLLIFLPGKRSKQEDVSAEDKLQQDITEYAKEQNREEEILSNDVVVVEQPKEEVKEEQTKPEAAEEVIPETEDKTAIVVDIEDESDVAYTKEYILNEAMPFFADNNQDAIWDLAHLKRYVKLSSELAGTGKYYYAGDVDGNGQPHGKGLAIYEDNAYYYGDWKNGKRDGDGRWFHFYIYGGKKLKANAYGIYMTHSYSGAWANDLPNGDGAEHFDVDTSKLEVRERIVQNIVGKFKNGLYDGDLYVYTADYTGTVEEWEAIAENGVFHLWRDMSAIGECSVLRDKNDAQNCIDIDVKDNQNQGIRDLLGLELTPIANHSH